MNSQEDPIEKKEKTSNKYAIGGLAFTACMFIGLGIGMYTGEKRAGLFIGMGIGFVAMVAIQLLNNPFKKQ